MQLIKNLLLTGTDNRPVALDIVYANGSTPKPVVVYVHGFNGFKDWGNFDLVAKQFAGNGFVMVKFNFSHNGTTPEHPEDFTDLEAFGHNNYTLQLQEIKQVVNWICDSANPYRQVMDTREICLLGHSLGGGLSILYASEDQRITRLITWAAISECKTPWGNWPAAKIQAWKERGVEYYVNGRTGQQMPMYYQLYEDYENNRQRLDIRTAILSLQIPVLICHGTLDGAVTVQQAYQLKEWQPAAQLFTVAADHVFDRKHPWNDDTLPLPMQAVVDHSIAFLKE